MYRRLAPRVHAYLSCRMGPAAIRETEDATAAALRNSLGNVGRSAETGLDVAVFRTAWATALTGSYDRQVAATTIEPPPVEGSDEVDRLGPRVLDMSDARRVVTATESLTDVQRDVLLLRFAGGLSSTTTGEVLAMEASDVRMVQATGIRLLATRFGGDSADHTAASPRAVDDFVGEVMSGRGDDEGRVPARVAATVRLLADAARVPFPADLDARLRARVLRGDRPRRRVAEPAPDSKVWLRRMVLAAMIVVLAAAGVAGAMALRRSSAPANEPQAPGVSAPVAPSGSGSPTTSTANPTSTATPEAAPSSAPTSVAPQSTPPTTAAPVLGPVNSTPGTDGAAPSGTKAPSVTSDTRPFTFSGDR